jgi:putative transposase
MARPKRLILEHVPVHVIQRGNDRQRVFRDDRDRQLFRTLLIEASLQCRCAVHAYVLMTNHVHLLVTADDADGISRLMQRMGRCYVRAFNQRHQRTGTLWEGRFRSSVVDSARYLLACSRYIDLNPVRAGLCDDPAQYRWSSHGNLAYGRPDALVTPHSEYERLGPTDVERQRSYAALCTPRLENAELHEIRRAVQRGEVLGRELFKSTIVQRIERAVTRASHGGDRKSTTYRSQSTTLTP